MGKKRTSIFVREYEKTGSFDDLSLPQSIKNRISDSESVIKRNKSLIEFKSVEVGIDYENLCFSLERVEEGNSKVLEKADVFS